MPVLHSRRMQSISRVTTVLCSFWNPEYASAYGSYLRAIKQQSSLFLIELKNSHADSSPTELGEVHLAADLLKICYSVTTALCANARINCIYPFGYRAAAPPNTSSSSLAALDWSYTPSYFSLNIVICIFFTCFSKFFCISIRKEMWKREALCSF